MFFLSSSGPLSPDSGFDGYTGFASEAQTDCQPIPLGGPSGDLPGLETRPGQVNSISGFLCG